MNRSRGPTRRRLVAKAPQQLLALAALGALATGQTSAALTIFTALAALILCK